MEALFFCASNEIKKLAANQFRWELFQGNGMVCQNNLPIEYNPWLGKTRSIVSVDKDSYVIGVGCADNECLV